MLTALLILVYSQRPLDGPPELHLVTLRVGQIQRKALALRTVPKRQFAGFNPLLTQISPYLLAIEGLYSQTKMIKVTPFPTRCATTGTPQLSINRNQVNERVARPDLVEPKLFLDTIQRAAQDIHIKIQHGRKISHTQNKVVYSLNFKHGTSHLNPSQL
jgi:hypothetical protein